jgi:hypothetical protein
MEDHPFHASRMPFMGLGAIFLTFFRIGRWKKNQPQKLLKSTGLCLGIKVPNLGFLPYPKCLHTNPHDKYSGFEMVRCTKMKQRGVSVLYIVEWNGSSS